MRMPGMSRGSLLRLLGELGHDFTTKFVDVKHFVSWVNLVPNNKISSGALLSSKIPKKEKPGGNHLSASCKYTQGGKMPAWRLLRHMRAKRGNRQAMVTTGKKLASIFYIMVQRKIEYDEQMYNNHRKEELQNKVIYLQKQLQRMELELANCR